MLSSVQQIGGGGLFAIVGARVWLEQGHARILVDTDGNPPAQVKDVMDTFGEDIFVWREGRATGSASIVYRGQERTYVASQPGPPQPSLVRRSDTQPGSFGPDSSTSTNPGRSRLAHL